MRSRWYSVITAIIANGSDAITKPIMPSTCFISAPAMITMPSHTTRKIVAEPRSGSANTSIAGTAAITSDVRNTGNVLTRSWLSERYFASTRITISLPISEGCTCVPKIGIQRLDPNSAAPSVSTNSRPRISPTYMPMEPRARNR